MLLNFFIKAALDLEVLDDSFDNQIAVFQLRQMVFEVSHSYEGSEVSSEEGSGFCFLRGLEAGASDGVAISFWHPP